MAIQLQVHEINTNGAVEDLLHSVAQVFNRNLLFGREDDPAPAAVVKPVRGIKRSFEKYLKISIEAADAADTISNVQLITTSVAPSGGVTLEAGAVAAFTAPLDTDSAVAINSLFNYTANNPLLVTPADTTYSTGVNADVAIAVNALLGSHVVLQMDVTPIAIAGQIDANYDPLSVIIRYDEA